MILILSLVTSIKDYLEVVHKFVEYDSISLNYTEFGSILTFILISIKNSIINFFNFSWLLKENLWSLPIIIPEISSAMISEISVLDGYFHNAFNFLDTPISYGISNVSFNGFISCLEKFIIGIINSLFLFLPTSTAHIITLRRFVMQGLEAGYISGLGTIAGNIFWLGSVVLGCRFFVIPWLSLDIFRYVLGFILLIKYMWDSYNEKKIIPGGDFLKKDQQSTNSNLFSEAREARFASFANYLNNNKKIFLLNFLLSLTEQTSIYPFISNISINPEISVLETFPLNGDFGLNNSSGLFFIGIHCSYLLGITLGSLSLLHLSCWFWENPAFKFYMWAISYFKVSTSFYYKILNFTFLYLTMLSAICSIPYYGLDYTITNPLGYVNDDRIIQDKLILETSFLGTKASDRNTRRNRGRHGRRERWKRRIRKYRTFDASLYDQGIYDLFTIEDLNYGFDRFWLRRKLRNHRVRFRFFPGPWMRSFKKQLAKPRLESYTGPRIEFFRILFEQVYHPSFHAYNSKGNSYVSFASLKNQKGLNNNLITSSELLTIPFSNYTSKANLVTNNSIYNVNMPNVVNNMKNDNFANQPTFSSQKQQFVNEVSEARDASFANKSLKTDLFLKVSPIVLKQKEQNLVTDNFDIQEKMKKSILRKFIRKFDNRVKTFNTINSNSYNSEEFLLKDRFDNNYLGGLFNKKNIYNNISLNQKQNEQKKSISLNNFNLIALTKQKVRKTISVLDSLDEKKISQISEGKLTNQISKDISLMPLNKKDLLILNYRSLLTKPSFNLQNNNSLMLLHPLKFYLQQEAGFKRKLRYYTPNIYRKFSIENNAPFFRVMMKRYFYHYKPTLRWERTMKTASLRKARRKTTRIPRKLQKTSEAREASFASFANTNLNPTNNTINENLETIDYSFTNKDNLNLKQLMRERELNSSLPIQLEKASLQKSTYNYSVVSKRANRYRYQIYKDVLQHWYYSPFNRILLKLDVDSFIKRQPNTHFLTSKEENLLHLRRYLLSEHYNTLRWYTNMQHYRSMKTQLNGGTKSFSSRVYNQQFAGTFKKIRHLFSITPSVNPMCLIDETKQLDFLIKKEITSKISKNLTEICTLGLQPTAAGRGLKTLKFDQPLYNEYYNNSKTPLLNPLIIHEELLSELNDKQPQNIITGEAINKTDLLSQSQNIIRQYLIQTRSIRETYIKKLLDENNYTELTKFIYKGQKTRGEQPVTNQKLFNNQEKNYLLNVSDYADLTSYVKSAVEDKNKNLYITFLKKWKRNVNDQESLKNYLNRRLEKREKRKQKKEKQLLNKLQRLENWFKISEAREARFASFANSSEKNNLPVLLMSLEKSEGSITSNDLLTTGLQKSIIEGMYTLNKIDTKIVSLNEKNLWKNLLLSKIKEKENSKFNQRSYNQKLYNRLQDLSLRFNELKQAKYIKISNNLKTSIQTIRKFIEKPTKNLLVSEARDASLASFANSIENSMINNKSKKNILNHTESSNVITGETINKTGGLFNKIKIYSFMKNKLSNFSQITLITAKAAKNKFIKLQKITNLLKPIQRKSLKDWRKKERVLSKQKRSRKEFKLLNKKSESILTYLDQNELELALKEPSRKKRDSNDTNMVNSLVNISDFNSKEKSLNFFNLFKRKRSPQRRSRVRRNRGVFKKRTLNDILRKDFLVFSNDKDSNLRFEFYPKFNNFLYSNDLSYTPQTQMQTQDNTLKLKSDTDTTIKTTNNFFDKDNSLKQRKSKQRKERYWKQKRSKYSQKRRKYRKRRRYTIVKIRTLNKQFKRFKNQIEIQNWWWKQFIPSIQASNEALWQIEKDKLIQQKLSQLSNSEILERDNLKLNDILNTPQAQTDSIFNILQIGNKDFKPLALPQTIRLNKESSNIISEANLVTGKNNMSVLYTNKAKDKEKENQKSQENQFESNAFLDTNNTSLVNNFQIINKLYESLFIRSSNYSNNLFSEAHEFLVPNTNLPFYAGWDESLRKLIVTNRMLSRKEAGFNYRSPFSFQNFQTTNIANVEPGLQSVSLANEKQDRDIFEYSDKKLEFSLAPLQGMNAATTLYWQIPFTTYDPDQFFALGMDGFSPIGWRKFLFRHSILKTWLMKKSQMDLQPEDANRRLNNNQKLNFLPTTSYATLNSKLGSGDQGVQLNSNEVKLKGHSITSFDNLNSNQLLKSNGLIVKNQRNIIKDFSLLSLHSSDLINEVRFASFANLHKFTTNSNETMISFAKDTYKQNKTSFAISRRLKKRYGRVKKHPRTPVWFPSGPLLNQVLPVHYIYVFYKRARLPRDRYLKRRLLNVKDLNNSKITNKLFSSDFLNLDTNNSFNYDFTLRKRLKPKRKYHLKRDYYASNVVIPRRFKFLSSSAISTSSDFNFNKWRPLSTLKIHKSISEVVKEQQLLRRSAQQKQKSSKQQQPNMRVKQLRRRVQRQILRSVWRYKPRSGGFVWPGDYLKLELVKVPKLQQITTSQNISSNLINLNGDSNNAIFANDKISKQKRKKKRTLVEWQLQPKKYLYEKHNLKVIKKKLLNSQRSFGSNAITLDILRNSI